MYVRHIHGFVFLVFVRGLLYTEAYNEETSIRANTLSDDADDIQRQLDNEARDRLKASRPKNIWVFHFPPRFSKFDFKEFVTRSLRAPDIEAGAKMPMNWNYRDHELWSKKYPSCGGRSQSPIDLSQDMLVEVKNARRLMFGNYDTVPMSMTVLNDGKTISVYGDWHRSEWPIVSGGAAYSRRYRFHSITFHWFSEHTINGLQLPVEMQALHIATEYTDLNDAVAAIHRDPQAILNIATLYKLSNTTHVGLRAVLTDASVTGARQKAKMLHPMPLGYYIPLMKEFVSYQGSLTTPPCTEGVLWLIRAKALPVQQAVVSDVRAIPGSDGSMRFNFRPVQPQNDRRVFFFH